MMDMLVTTVAINCAKLQSDCHHQQTNTQLSTGQMPFLSPNQQCQSTEGESSRWGVHSIQGIEIFQAKFTVLACALFFQLHWLWTSISMTGWQRCACIAAYFSSFCSSSCSASTHMGGGHQESTTCWYLNLIHAIILHTRNLWRSPYSSCETTYIGRFTFVVAVAPLAPCRFRGWKNRPAPFPSRMSYRVT